jgi:hypothetical protein
MKTSGSRIQQIVRLLISCAAFLWMAESGCWAEATHQLDLPAMIESSQLIVVGQVVATERREKSSIQIANYTATGSWYTAKLGVNRVIKGDSDSKLVTFRYFIPDDISYGRPIAAQQFGVFFLQTGSDGYEPTDGFHPFTMALPEAPVTQGSYLDQVVAEMDYVLKSPKTTRDDRIVTEVMLHDIKAPSATAALRDGAADPDDTVRLYSIASLLMRNDISQLDTVEKLLLHPDPWLVITNNSDRRLDSLAGGIFAGVRDPKAVPTLIRLLKAPSSVTRRAAAFALGSIPGQDSATGLVSALNDSDSDVRYFVAISLAQVTGQDDWLCSEEFYKQNEKRYLDHWHEWAESKK